MPFTLNGVGTMYYGRRNATQQTGVCDHCHREGVLISYDTKHYFVILFIPIIPLGSLHVIEECPSCTRFRVMPLHKWTALIERELGGSIRAYLETPSHPELAKLAMCQTLAFNHEDSFLAISEELENALPQNAEILTMRGTCYEHFKFLPAAETSYRQSLAIRPDAKTSRRLAIVLINQNQLEEARDILDPFIVNQDSEVIPFVGALVDAYKQAQQHVAALELMDHMMEAFPDLAKDTAWARSYKATAKTMEKSGGTADPVVSQILNRRSDIGKRSPLVAWSMVLVAAVIVATLLIGWIVAHANKTIRIHLVNGTQKPYSVTVNRQALVLTPGRKNTVSVPVGDIAISAGFTLPQQMVHVGGGWLPWIDSSQCVVINPDQTAILKWIEADYNAGQNGKYVEKLYAGRFVQEFDGIDFQLTPLPQSVMVQQINQTATRRAVEIFPTTNAFISAATLEANLGLPAAHAWLRAWVLHEPDDSMGWNAMMEFFTPRDLESMLEPRLDERPVQIELHRTYQEVALWEVDNPDIESRYRKMLADSPDNAPLMYLLGRVAKDDNESLSLFAAAADDTHPVAYAKHALSLRALAEGDILKARQLITHARAIDKSNLGFVRIEYLICIAAQDYSSAKSALDTMGKYMGDYSTAKTVELMSSWGIANSVIDSYILDMTNLVGLTSEEQKERTRWRHYLTALACYTRSTPDEFATEAKASGNPAIRFSVAVVTSDLDAAEKIASEPGNESPEPHLLLAALMRDGGNEEGAKRQFALAIEQMKKAGRTWREALELLQQHQPPSAKALSALALAPSDQVAVLATLAQLHPKQASIYASKANRLNITPGFPQREWQQVLASLLEP